VAKLFSKSKLSYKKKERNTLNRNDRHANKRPKEDKTMGTTQQAKIEQVEKELEKLRKELRPMADGPLWDQILVHIAHARICAEAILYGYKDPVEAAMEACEEDDKLMN